MGKHKSINNSIAVKMKDKLDAVIRNIVANKALYIKDPERDFTRKRKLDLATMIMLILSMQGNSLSKELFEFFKYSESLVSASAFVQQRDKILPELFKAAFDKFNAMCEDKRTYNGYHLYAVDGSDITIATNPDSTDTYYEQGFNQLHLNALYDLMNKTYVDCVVQPSRKEHEVRAAIEMILNTTFPENSILIADRGYESANLYEYVNRKDNLDYLIRVQNSLTKELRNLPMQELDHIQSYELRTTQTKEDKEAFARGEAKWIPGPSKFGKKNSICAWDFESPCRITQRVVRFEISSGNYETILTSLSKEEFPLEEIKKLYHLRWGIETSFRELKYAIGMINFHAKKEEYILQEIYAALIMYNFCERITMAVVIYQSNDRKHEYQVNFTMAIHICRDYFSCGMNSPPIDVVKMIASYVLPVRPGRADKRKLRPKGAVFFLYRIAA